MQCYPPPGLYKLLLGFAESRGMGTSEAAVHMMRCFFQNPNHGATSSPKAAREAQVGLKER